MTQIFSEDGRVTPVTAVLVDTNTITRVKNMESDGYSAVIVGYGEQKASRVSKPLFVSNGNKAYKTIKEFRIDGITELNAGDIIDASTFSKGDAVTVTGISKAKGFQGVVKRHGFHGGPRSHGQKHSEREPGSIGGGLRTRVPKGMRMAGRMGGDTITVKGLKIVAVDAQAKTIYISGAVPGRRGTLISIIA